MLSWPRRPLRSLVGHVLSDCFTLPQNLWPGIEIDPGSDIHATQEYREHVTQVLVIKRALSEALRRARR